MDVIALGKATKAKKAIKSLNDRLGEGVEDVYTNVKTRLEELEKKDPHVALYNRVSGVESNNAINLNKHNLHVNTILNKSKFGLTDLAFDDFADATGIDVTKSTGQVFDAVGKKFVINPAATEAELVTTAESLADVPQMITVSQVFNEQNIASELVDIVNGTLTDVEAVDGKIQLKVVGTQGIGYTGNIIPAMTSNTSPEGIASASGEISGFNSWYAFDRSWTIDVNSGWSKTTFVSGDWLSYEFSEPKTILKYTLVPHPYGNLYIQMPKSWTFERWDETNSNWIVLDTQTDITFSSKTDKKEFTFMNTNESKKYRILISSNNGSAAVSIGEMEMMESAIQNFYSSSGSYESPIVDLGDNFKSLNKVENIITVPAGAGITISTATSADSIIFSEYLPVNTDNTIASPSDRYIKVKVDLAGGALVTPRIPMDFVASEVSNFPVNDKVIFDGSLHMKTAYSYSMNPDASFIETGTLLKKTINRSNYKTIEKIEVK
jgi:nitrate reductase NapAB chaperone NapD